MTQEKVIQALAESGARVVLLRQSPKRGWRGRLASRWKHPLLCPLAYGRRQLASEGLTLLLRPEELMRSVENSSSTAKILICSLIHLTCPRLSSTLRKRASICFDHILCSVRRARLL